MIANSIGILIVDDDQDAVANLLDILGNEGYRLDSASDGMSALRLARRKHFDLAIVDFLMPFMDGAVLISKLKALQPHIESILLTGLPDDELRLHVAETNLCSLIRKPVDVESLLNTIASLVSTRATPEFPETPKTARVVNGGHRAN